MMTAVALSICIPVYNCGEYLPCALDSILFQTDESVEVIVYDGASTDNTPSVMQAYARPGVRYFRGAARGGIDADLATCIGYARGEYCWLFSGDDVMRPGALARALQQIRAGADLILCRHTICDIRMRVQTEYMVLEPAHEPADVEFADLDLRRSWFARAATTEAFFSFLSGIVVRKQAWDRGGMHPAFATSCWAHAARLLALASQGLRVSYVPEIWLDQRGENDSFAHAGVVNRFRIAIEGYQAIADSLFGHASFEAFHIRRVLRREFRLWMLLSAKILCSRHPVRENRRLLDSLAERLYCDRSMRNRVFLWTYRLTPPWVAAGLRRVLRLSPVVTRWIAGPAGAPPHPTGRSHFDPS